MEDIATPPIAQAVTRFTPEAARWERISRELLSWVAGRLRPPAWDEADIRTASFTGFAQGIGPYLDYLYRTDAAFQRLPPDFRAALAHQRAGNQQRSARILSEAERVFAALHGAGIPAIPLKGIAVAPQVYPAADLRPMADIDVLVSPDHLDAAGQLVAALGYDTAEQTWKHLTYRHPQTRRVVDTTAEHPDNPLRVEVHSRFAQFFWGLMCDLTARLWQRARPGPFLATRAMLLPPGETLLVVAVHASASILTHHQARIVHLLDVAHLAKTIGAPDDWATVLTDWGPSRLRFAYPAIGLTAALLPGSIPGDTLARMQRAVPRRLVAWADGGDAFFPLTHFGSAPRSLNALEYIPRLVRHPLELVQMGWHSLFPPRWYLAARFPRWAGSRWLALAYLRLAWQRLRSVGRDGAE